MHRIVFSAFISATLFACSQPPPPKDPVDVSVEPTDENEVAPPAEPASDEPESEEPAEEESDDELGVMWGDSIGDTSGAGGLGLSGTGRGGGGTGIGTISRIVPAHGLGGNNYSSVVNRVIRQQSSKVKSCYEQALKRDGPGTGGRLVVKFTIAPDGTVASAKADPGITAQLDACVVAAIRGAQFPAPPKGQPTMVSYPFILKSN